MRGWTSLIMLLLLVAMPSSCNRPQANPSDASAALVETKIEREFNEQERKARLQEMHAKNRGVLVPSPYGQDARSAARRVEVWWHVRHACGTSLRPEVSRRGNLITLSPGGPSEVADGQACITVTVFKTVLRDVGPNRYRIVGPDLDRSIELPAD